MRMRGRGGQGSRDRCVVAFKPCVHVGATYGPPPPPHLRVAHHGPGDMGLPLHSLGGAANKPQVQVTHL